jgi:uncharacterized Zn finger protein (UPF0148 family)
MTLYMRRKLAGECGSCGHRLPQDAGAVLCATCRDRNIEWKAQHPDRVREHRRRYSARRA